MENLYSCSFKSPKSLAVMACVWLPPILFFIFYLSVVCYKQLVQFLWLIFFAFVGSIFLLIPYFQYIQPERRPFYRVRVFWNVFFFNFSIVVLRTKSNHCLQRPWPFSLILLLKQRKSDWSTVVSFVFSANQKPFVICARVTSFALVLQKNCTPFSVVQN